MHEKVDLPRDPPFTKEIMIIFLPLKFKMPQLKSYDGTTDPADHLESFKMLMMLHGASDAILCRAFSATLKKTARTCNLHSSTWMDSSTHADAVSGDIGCEPYVYSLRCEKSHVEHKECTCCNMKETAKITPQEVLDISSVIEEDHFEVQEAGVAPSTFLHFSNLDGRISGPNAICDQDEALGPQEIKACQVSCNSISLVTNKQRSLSKWATFPSSLELPLDTLSIEENNVGSRAEIQHQHSSTAENPAYARTMSLPTSWKLVSAMKGGRAQNGIHATMKLYVKWAPEVYDPLAISLSHTVKKSQHQCAKAKKKHHKNKRKGKSSRGSGAERKHANRSSASRVSDPVDTRIPAAEDAAGDRLLFDGYGKSNVEVFEYAVSTNESKCGSSFLREALKVHLSTAEAS